MMTQTLSTDVVTAGFGCFLHRAFRDAAAEAQEMANENGAPCGIWLRDGWYTVCEVAPEDIVPDPALSGWRLDAVVDPSGQE